MEDNDPEPYWLAFNQLAGILLQPITIDVIFLFLATILLLILSALISGSEVAFFSLSPTQINDLRSDPNRINQRVLSLISKPKDLLATILIANNFTNISIIIISTIIVDRLILFGSSRILTFFIQVLTVTILILLFGEILPKMIATQYPVRYSKMVASFMRFLEWLFHPMSVVLIRSTSFIDKNIKRKGHDVSLSELGEAIDMTSDQKVLEEDRKILKGIVKFGDIEATEIMKPRIDVTAVDISTPFGQLMDLIINSGYSRIPVFENSFDKILGILYIKDLLPYLESKEDVNWAELLRPAFFVPENKKISDLLQEFRAKKIHMAIVVDEYGGTSGIITLEDIIEEIVGEINDEFDVDNEDLFYSKIDEHNFIFEGKTLLNDFCKVMGVEDKVFLKVKGESDTLAGLLLELMGKIPQKDESIDYDIFTFRVDAVDKRRIKRIHVSLNK